MTTPNLPQVVLEAFEVAQRMTARFDGFVVVRLIDADAFLDPSWLPHRAPRRSVEVFAGVTGILVVPMDQGADLDATEIQYPVVLDESGGLFAEDASALGFAVLCQVRRGMLAIAQQVAPRARGLLGP